MRAIIPHRSIAILTSAPAGISDPLVHNLADGIIEAQRLEIDEMEALIDDPEAGSNVPLGFISLTPKT